jgi:hypothetical protein
MDEMKYRVSIDFVGRGNAAKAYGGRLDAWSFVSVDPMSWFSQFRRNALESIGNRYLPVYRMADGEFRFLMGRKYNIYNRPLWKELVAVSSEKLRLKNPDSWKTSWGESYSPAEAESLRESLLSKIRFIAECGFLACYINDNGLNAFTEYNRHIQPYFCKEGVPFHDQNYVPFHFVCALLVNEGWEEFYEGRKILIVSGTDDSTEIKLGDRLRKFGAKNIEFLRVSKTSAMKDKINLNSIHNRPDICLVAAGVGAANIIAQLEDLRTLVLDIGGYINCLVDPSRVQHGGVFGLPAPAARS